MIKFGITSLERMMVGKVPQNRMISGALLLELHARPDLPNRDELRQEIVRRLVLQNRTGKTTWEGRFADLDAWLAERLLPAFPERLRVLDVGASDGTTSVELFERLSGHPDLSFLSTDLNRDIWVAKGPIWQDVIDDDGKLIQTTVGPCVVPVTDGVHINPLLLVNRAIYFYCKTFRKDMRARLPVNGADRPEADEDVDGSLGRFSLLAPKARQLLKNDPRFRFERLDAFQIGGSPHYDFVRIMNVLNIDSDGFGFSAAQIAKAVPGILGAISDGGRLLIGRTSPAGDGFEHNATLFYCSAGQLSVNDRFGKGSEIESLLLSAAGAPPEQAPAVAATG